MIHARIRETMIYKCVPEIKRQDGTCVFCEIPKCIQKDNPHTAAAKEARKRKADILIGIKH